MRLPKFRTLREPGKTIRRPMQEEPDRVAIGAKVRRLGPDFRWPGGHKIAVVFNIAYEGWSDGVAPGLGPMGNPLPAGVFDTNALSWGSYGDTAGIFRLLRIFDRLRIRTSVMTSGIFAGRSPETVKAIADAGHEIVAHAYAQDIIPARLTPEEVEADIRRTTEALASVTGKRPIGWISPRGTPSPHSARLLVKAGYDWHGDAFDDDAPYLQTLDGGSIVAIPLTMELNDLPHAMRYGRSPQDFIGTFGKLLTAGLMGREPVMIDVTAHCHVYGRPFGAWAIDMIGRAARQSRWCWIATRAEMAAHVRSVLG